MRREEISAVSSAFSAVRMMGSKKMWRAQLLSLATALVLLTGCAAGLGLAEERLPVSSSLDATPPAPEVEPSSARLPTWGGVQFWTDELVFRSWRVQRHSLTGVYRLLDQHDRLCCTGSFDSCQQKLDEIKREQHLAPMGSRVVIVLHGLGRSRNAMEPLREYLDEQEDLEAIAVSYASTRASLAEHAAALAKIIEHLEGVEQIDFVAHSLGNLVIRRYLADLQKDPQRAEQLPEVGRIVMLAPPNQGADLAERFRNNPLFRLVWGDSGDQIARSWDDLHQSLVVPPGEFAIIAGSGPELAGDNPLIEGPDDWVVSVEETRLPGARDFVVAPVAHTFIMDDAAVREYILNFLRHGYLVAEDRRSPIPLESQRP